MHIEPSIQHLLEEAGYEIVPFTQRVCMCAQSQNMADRKSRQMLHKAKKNNPDSIVVAAKLAMCRQVKKRY